MLMALLSIAVYFYFDNSNNHLELKQLSDAKLLLTSKQTKFKQIKQQLLLSSIDLIKNVKNVKSFYKSYPVQSLTLHPTKKVYRGMQYNLLGTDLDVLISLNDLLSQPLFKVDVNKLLFKNGKAMVGLTILGK